MSEPIIVPRERLTREALLGVVEAYVLREGTDYGHDEPSLEEKRAEVLRQLERGDVVIVFDPASEQVLLTPRRELGR